MQKIYLLRRIVWLKHLFGLLVVHNGVIMPVFPHLPMLCPYTSWYLLHWWVKCVFEIFILFMWIKLQILCLRAIFFSFTGSVCWYSLSFISDFTCSFCRRPLYISEIGLVSVLRVITIFYFDVFCLRWFLVFSFKFVVSDLWLDFFFMSCGFCLMVWNAFSTPEF